MHSTSPVLVTCSIADVAARCQVALPQSARFKCGTSSPSLRADRHKCFEARKSSKWCRRTPLPYSSTLPQQDQRPFSPPDSPYSHLPSHPRWSMNKTNRTLHRSAAIYDPRWPTTKTTGWIRSSTSLTGRGTTPSTLAAYSSPTTYVPLPSSVEHEHYRKARHFRKESARCKTGPGRGGGVTQRGCESFLVRAYTIQRKTITALGGRQKSKLQRP